MQQDFLRHIWQSQQFDCSELKTVQGEPLQILHPGFYLQMTDSDFFNAQLLIGTLRWVGSVAVYPKSSDWNAERMSVSDNVILLVVHEHDAKVSRNDQAELPVLELQAYLTPEIVQHSKSTRVKKIIKFVTDLWD